MEDWRFNDANVLAFDLNLCTLRELCEVFGMGLSRARDIQEYRQETLHVFKLDQLLKLEGMTHEMIQQWSNPKSSDDFDREFQRSLKMQVDTPEPLPKLLEGLCQLTGASGGLIAAQDGRMIMQFTHDGSLFDPLAREISNFVRPVQEDILQMNLGLAEMQVIGFESFNLLFLPTSGFHLTAMHPKDDLTFTTLNLWRALAAEIRRRHPPKIYIDNHAHATKDDVVFKCLKCGLKLIVHRAGIGYTFLCPRCKTNVTVPAESTASTSSVGP